MTLWFTSDTHWGHTNILKFCNRPFEHTHAHDEALIENWNNKVKQSDQVYHLGDVALCAPRKLVDILNRLNGRISFISGNHDKTALRPQCRERFEEILEYKEITIQDQELDNKKQIIILFHYPLLTWNKKNWGSWHLHGHCHHTLPIDRKSARLDVGVDGHNFSPISYQDIKTIFSIRKLEYAEENNH